MGRGFDSRPGDGGPDARINDGGKTACEPGDIECLDEGTVATCVDGSWQARDCDEVCKEAHGAGAVAVSQSDPSSPSLRSRSFRRRDLVTR